MSSSANDNNVSVGGVVALNRFCTSCGTPQANQGQNFCGNCGTSLLPAQTTLQMQQQQRTSPVVADGGGGGPRIANSYHAPTPTTPVPATHTTAPPYNHHQAQPPTQPYHQRHYQQPPPQQQNNYYYGGPPQPQQQVPGQQQQQQQFATSSSGHYYVPPQQHSFPTSSLSSSTTTTGVPTNDNRPFIAPGTRQPSVRLQKFCDAVFDYLNASVQPVGIGYVDVAKMHAWQGLLGMPQLDANTLMMYYQCCQAEFVPLQPSSPPPSQQQQQQQGLPQWASMLLGTAPAAPPPPQAVTANTNPALSRRGFLTVMTESILEDPFGFARMFSNVMAKNLPLGVDENGKPWTVSPAMFPSAPDPIAVQRSQQMVSMMQQLAQMRDRREMDQIRHISGLAASARNISCDTMCRRCHRYSCNGNCF